MNLKIACEIGANMEQRTKLPSALLTNVSEKQQEVQKA